MLSTAAATAMTGAWARSSPVVASSSSSSSSTSKGVVVAVKWQRHLLSPLRNNNNDVRRSSSEVMKTKSRRRFADFPSSGVTSRAVGRFGARVAVRCSATEGEGDALNHAPKPPLPPPQRPKSVLANLAAAEDGDQTAAGRCATTSAVPAAAAKAAAAAVLGGAAIFGTAAFAPPPLGGARPAVAATTTVSTFTHSPASAGDVFAYKVQKVFALPLFGKICFLFLFTVPMVAVGGMMYKAVGPDDPEEEDGEGESWQEAMAQSFYLLNNVPGADATGDSTLKRAAVTQTIVLIGMFVFAIIIGIISDEIASKVEEVKTGNSRVVETDHTVIVNWNAQLIPLLKQMAVAKAERVGTFDKPVVLLADIDKEAMDEELDEALDGCPPLEVVTRRGSPYVPEDLAKVNANFARRVIILHPRDNEMLDAEEDAGSSGGNNSNQSIDEEEVSFLSQQRAEARKATVVLNLRQQATAGGGNPDLVVQMPVRLPQNQDLVHHALEITRRQEVLSGMASADDDSARPYVQVHGSENTGKICAFSAFQPGAARIYEELLEQSDETPEFYLSLAPQFVGKTFGQAWRMLPQATLCGLNHADGTVELAPSDDTVILADDEVVLLAESSVVKISPPDEAAIPRAGSERRYMRNLRSAFRKHKPVNLLFAGFRSETSVAVEMATEMAPPGSTVTILAEYIPREDLKQLKSTKNCKLKVMKGVPTSYRDLKAANVVNMDTIIVMPDRKPEEADAEALATVLQTDAICSEAASERQNGNENKQRKSRSRDNHGVRAPRVVAMLNTDSARAILEGMTIVGEHPTRPDVIMSNNIIGGALLQVAANPKLAGLFDTLLETEGHEVYSRDADEYVDMDTTRGDDDGGGGEEVITWGTICERARMRNELALGYTRASGEIELSPAKGEEIVLEEGDRVIVLAENLY